MGHTKIWWWELFYGGATVSDWSVSDRVGSCSCVPKELHDLNKFTHSKPGQSPQSWVYRLLYTQYFMELVSVLQPLATEQ